MWQIVIFLCNIGRRVLCPHNTFDVDILDVLHVFYDRYRRLKYWC